MLYGYFLLLYMHGQNSLVDAATGFYEIPNLQVQVWWLIFLAGSGGSLLLLILEKIRGLVDKGQWDNRNDKRIDGKILWKPLIQGVILKD